MKFSSGLKNNRFLFFLSSRYHFILTSVFIILGIVLVSRHELWSDEIFAWHISSESTSLNQLFSAEFFSHGHPHLNRLILYVLSHYVLNNFLIMQYFHLTLAAITAFLILKYAPFNKTIKTILVFGYFFFYEYSIISRDYALGILFIILFCVLYPNKERYLVYIGIVLFFMGQANFYSFIISLALIIFLLVDLLSLRQKMKSVGILKITGFLITVLLGIFLMILQYKDRAIQGTVFNPSLDNLFREFYIHRTESIISTAQGIVKGIIPLSSPVLHFWNSSILVIFLMNFQFRYTFALAAILLLLPLFMIKRKIIILYSTAVLGMIFMMAVIYNSKAVRHFGHFFVIILISFWLSEARPFKDERYLINSDIASKMQKIFFIIILSAALYSSIIAGYYDFRYPFASGKLVAQYIQNKYEDNILIAGYKDRPVETVAAYLDKEILLLESNRYGKMSSLNTFRESISFLDAFKNLENATDKNEKFLLIKYKLPMDDEESNTVTNGYMIKEEITFENSILSNENFFLYELERLK